MKPIKKMLIALVLTVLTFILVLTCCPRDASGQTTNYTNTLFVSYSPVDNSIGVRADFQPMKNLGFYGSMSSVILHGNYYLLKDKTEYIKDHNKFAMGIFLPVKVKIDCGLYAYNNFSLGLTHHTYGARHIQSIRLSQSVFDPVSFEIGCGTKIKRFALSVTTDVLKWQSWIYLGINF